MPTFQKKLFCQRCDIPAELIEEKGKPDRVCCSVCGISDDFARAVDTATDYLADTVGENAADTLFSSGPLDYFKDRGPDAAAPDFVIK